METDPTSSGNQATGEPFDDRADLYRKSGDLVTSIARHHAGIDVDETTGERWRQIMGLMREVDTWADDSGATKEDVLKGLKEFVLFKDRYPALTRQALGHQAHQALLRHTRRILTLGEYASVATDVKRYSDLRAGEGRRSVELFAITATPQVASHPNFQSKFMPTVKALGESATLWDSVIDGMYDKKTGKQQITPGPRFYMHLTARVVAVGKKGGRALMNPATVRHLAIKGAMRVANRVRNGIPEYSNLRFLRRRSK